ncbi:serpin family protein [Limnospira sp. PMC 289.06]|uniref:serpin family protein n=1 Tax=Limnospira sp. PMC 289.06 TaxID=2981094 RepID=UPI0028E0E791|nr:serpin family protein [Limnospira sp. PMC 289.06]
MKKLWANYCQYMGLLIATAVMVAVSGWAIDQIPDSHLISDLPAPQTTENMAMNDQVVAAYTGFAFRLFSRVYQHQNQENIFISPASITNALAMTYNGAAGTTKEAIAQTLQVQDISLAELNQANLALNQSISALDEDVQINIANSLWLHQSAFFLPDFLDRINQFYQAKLTAVDFSSPDTPSQINDWVKQETNGKITQIVETIPNQTILYLINAIYFKGMWSEPFDKELTQEQPFTLIDGSTKLHPLMFQFGNYLYLENSDFQGISLPYGDDARFSLYVFLPRENVSLDRFYTQLNATQWEEWIKQMRSRPGSIQLPRFQLEYEVGLNDSLKSMGMDIAFDPNQADFSNLTPDNNVRISEVKHKTFVEVNEEGTEAAAVTSVTVFTESTPSIPEPFSMVVNRPFFLAIRDNQTRTILFMGSIVDPGL